MQHIDAAFCLLRERVWLFPKTYGTKIAIIDSIFEQYIRGRYPQFKDKRMKDNFDWDESILDYVNGNEGQFKRSWFDVDEIYYVMNLKVVTGFS